MDTSALKVQQVRPASIPTPHRFGGRLREGATGLKVRYVDDAERVLVDVAWTGSHELSFERAGPRAQIAFEPGRCTAAVLTSGGLCPGLNSVVQSVVHGLHFHYGVGRILGVKNGFRGLMQRDPAVGPLGPEQVRGIHVKGGSVLGSARIEPDVPAIADAIERLGVDVLFCIGGDGTQKGAHALYLELERRGVEVAVVGVPKTIDNDISWVDKTFGFDTAVEVAVQAVRAAHVEAEGAVNGLGLVQLMGRDSGFIAASAALASQDVNFVLVPEVPFELEGPHGLHAALERRLATRGHAVVVVAEGAGRAMLQAAGAWGPGMPGIGIFLRDRITEHFRARRIELVLKFIDPSYIIRAAPANASDSIFCAGLGHHAVHAAMAGKTDLVVGTWNGAFTHVPIPLAVEGRKKIVPESDLWRTVVENTGQPELVNR